MSYTLKPDEVRAKYGKMFCKGFYTIVDEKNGIAQLIEICTSKGPVEWDIVNRKRTGGVLTDLRLEGTTVTMDAVVGGNHKSWQDWAWMSLNINPRIFTTIW